MTAKHACHALGCDKACPPAHLMCRACWARVPADMQAEVYRTVRLRDMGSVDETWAPWWRAQAHATYHVAMERDRLDGRPVDPRGEKYLERELVFAQSLEADKSPTPRGTDQ